MSIHKLQDGGRARPQSAGELELAKKIEAQEAVRARREPASRYP